MLHGAVRTNRGVGCVPSHRHERDVHDGKSFNQDLCKWNVIRDTDMSFISLKSNECLQPGQTKGNVGKIMYMHNMFGGAKAFNQDLSKWNVNK